MENTNAFRSGFVTILGRPNVGKSSIMNRIVGEKVAIVSDKPQTTRTRIMGVVTRDKTQLVFLDTPGNHKPRTRLGDFMVKVIRDTVSDVDTVMLVVEPVPRIGIPEQMLLDKIKECGLTLCYGGGDAPFFEEAELVLVCRKLYMQDLDPVGVLEEESVLPFYGKKGGWHRMYVGRVEEAYLK